MNNDTENSDLKRRIKALERENKRLKKDNECDKIIQTINNVHQALKPLYVRLDELVLNRGLEHIALNIFQHLDLPTLSRCRQVSSNWKKCIEYFFNHWSWFCFKWSWTDLDMFGGLLETLGQPADDVLVVVQQRTQHYNMTKWTIEKPFYQIS